VLLWKVGNRTFIAAETIFLAYHATGIDLEAVNHMTASDLTFFLKEVDELSITAEDCRELEGKPVCRL